MLTTVETTIAKIEFDTYTISAEGVIGDVSEWEFTITYKSGLLAPKSWKRKEFIIDYDDLTNTLWEEAIANIQRYHSVTFDQGAAEIFIEDEEADLTN